MIITDIKEIYEKVEVGDTLTYYKNSYMVEENIISTIVTGIEECTKCNDIVCRKKIHTIRKGNCGCYWYGVDKCSLINLIKKEEFIKEEEFKV
jgi:hypothetical protein